ncbi:MAG: tRNA (adenosine(37)-N6)-dimethylallyltransferase MiaA [Alphaproteobacteria bacterium]|nr:tRNA (adenosine(37)-N6)-dimethylallyltransferase MiaA [Alphaproteobacteria bacterium]
MTTRAILLAGPTASGKSQVAIALAEGLKRHGGAVIVNADSQQVYRELRILTARPSLEDTARVEHCLYGCLDAGEYCSAGRWRGLALEAIEAATSAGKIAIVVGGSGLYFRALLEGLAPIPDIPATVRAESRALLAAIGPEALHRRLEQRDPVMAARIGWRDGQRLARAWEVLAATGRSLAAWQAEGESAPRFSPLARLILTPARDELVARIDRRFAAMVAAGAVEEVRALDALGHDPMLPAMKAVGASALRAYIRGEIGLDGAIANGQAATRQYAKRQSTWFRHQMADWTPVVEQ